MNLNICRAGRLPRWCPCERLKHTIVRSLMGTCKSSKTNRHGTREFFSRRCAGCESATKSETNALLDGVAV